MDRHLSERLGDTSLRSLESPSLTEMAPLALLYHENSKINRATAVPLAESIGEFAGDIDQLRRSTTAAKTYPSDQRIHLNRLGRLPVPNQGLNEVLAGRRSVRNFQDKLLPSATVASLLHHACGVTGELVHPEHADIRQPLRAYPSAGALYPIETYLIAVRVEGLSAGIYHFHSPDNCLEVVRLGDLSQRMDSLVLHGGERLAAPAVIVLTARWELLIAKYGERSYRVMALDAGHLAQNILLVATALGLGGCPIGGFYDDALAADLGLDPREEPPQYVITLGYPCSTSPSRRC